MRSLFLAAVLITASAHAQLTADQQQKIDAAANKVLAETGVPSASLGIVVDGRIAYTHAYGLARTSPPMPATPAMAYPIGSISKQFTAVGVLLLQQHGKLSIDDPVGKYFPELTRANDVKLRNLMTMTSGYEDFAPQDYSIPVWYTPRRPIDTVREWATKPLDFEPGTEWQYSNTNYVLLALIVEKVTGEPFYKFLKREVLDAAHLPLAFNAYAHREQLVPLGYVSYALQQPRVLPLEAEGWYFGDGELAMPASSLLTWDITFLNQTVLSHASYKEMETPFIFTGGPNAGKPSNYGLGVFIGNKNGHRQIEHSGEVGGYVAENVDFLDDHIAISVLTNQVASSAAGKIAAAVSETLFAPAAATAPAPAADPVASALPGILAQLAQGKLDRSLFTANCNAYFSADALHDFAATLAPLGAVKSVTRTGTSLRGGMTFGIYKVVFATGTTLTLDTYTLPGGLIEQLLILSKS